MGSPGGAQLASGGAADGQEIDLAAEIEGLRQQADAHDAMLRKHHAAVAQLADSVGKLVETQRKRNRSINLNSFVAYVLFTVLLGGAFFALYRERIKGLVPASKAVAAAAPKVEVVPVPVMPTPAAKVVEAAPVVAPASAEPPPPPISLDSNFSVGLAAYRVGDLPGARTAFRTFLEDHPDSPQATAAHYYLGMVAIKAGDPDLASLHLRSALKAQLDPSIVDARYWLAVAYEKTGDLEHARIQYDKFATAYPQNELAVTARRKSANLAVPKASAAQPPSSTPKP